MTFGDFDRPLQSMDRIKVRVFDTDMFTDDLVGETEHALEDLQLENGKEQPFKLMLSGTQNGYVRIKATMQAV